MIGRTGKIQRISVEDLLKLSLKDIRIQIEKSGYNLGEIITRYNSGKITEVAGTLSWTRTFGGIYKTTEKAGRIGYSLGKDTEGVYLRLNYSCKRPGESEFKPVELRYYLVAKESNLKPGTYRYYFLDPYSEEDPGFCTKLYLFDGYFYPRSVLRDYGVLYKQQREGYTQRYVYTFSSRVPDYWRKYGKTHYRGRITPGYRRYSYLSEESDRRTLADLLWKYPEIALSLQSSLPEEKGESPIETDFQRKDIPVFEYSSKKDFLRSF